jgi:hypothetical protein
MKKIIELNCRIQPNITSLEHEKETVTNVIRNIYELHQNENNENNKEYALHCLADSYRYVHNKYSIVPGLYVRYIDTKDHTDMKVKLGGFVISDNGYSIVYKNANRFVKLNKKHCILFVSITYNEQIRCAIE